VVGRRVADAAAGGRGGVQAADAAREIADQIDPESA
jgi:hypothetical protein